MARVINESVEMVKTNTLSPWPKNPRNGDLDAIAESIRVNGFFGTLVVQSSTRQVLAGNHRWAAALEVGLEEVPVVWVDVDDDSAARINIADNRTADLSWNDEALVAELLQDLDGLEGTGYNDEALRDILKKTSEPLGPDDFKDYDENLDTAHTCPRCGYEFS